MAWAIAAASALRARLARIWVRLLVVHVVVAAVPLVGISFAHTYERQLLAELERDMAHQGELVRSFVAAGAAGAAGASAAATTQTEAVLVRAARDTRTRIRVLDDRGAVVADSHRAGPPEGAERPTPRFLRAPPPPPRPHEPGEVPPVDLARRPEVVRALGGRYGTATRVWDTQDRVFLFVALPVPETHGVVYVTRSTRDVMLALLQLRAWLVKILLGTLVATSLISLFLATTIARPLSRLTRRARRIAAQAPVEPHELAALADRRDELGQLARALAAMTDELERRARDARTLAADISHEFKTPLTGIRGAAELLRDGGAGDDPHVRERFLRMIEDDAARLDRLVSRLLELARVEDDRGTLLPVDLAQLAGDIAARRPWPVPVRVVVEPARAGTASAPGGDARLRGRRAALASAIENLVANAVQHTTETDAYVTVTITGARIAVANRGPALSAAARAKVWDRFYSTRHADGGSGLGLAIVRSVALAHGGTYGCDSRAGTTTFWFTAAP